MGKAYSQDLRDRVIDAVKRGQMSRRAAGAERLPVVRSRTVADVQAPMGTETSNG